MPRLSVGGARRSSLWRRLRPRAPALALLALAALALGGILAPEAEAQTETGGVVRDRDCECDQRYTWSWVLGRSPSHGPHGRHAVVTDDDFDIGHDLHGLEDNDRHLLQEYRPRFTVATGSTPAVADLPDKDELILRLTYGGEAGDFTLSDATYTDSSGDR